MPSGEDRAAAARLRMLIAGDAAGAEAVELMQLADAAVSGIVSDEWRGKIAENLIASLTVLKFGGLLGQDIEVGRSQALAILDALDKAPPPDESR
jgi:hypothetical protein